MVKRILLSLLTLLAACGDETNDVIACEPGTWGLDATCEPGCAAGPSGAVDVNMDQFDDTCSFIRADVESRCAVNRVATYGELRGCCIPNAQHPTRPGAIEFLACEGE